MTKYKALRLPHPQFLKHIMPQGPPGAYGLSLEFARLLYLAGTHHLQEPAATALHWDDAEGFLFHRCASCCAGEAATATTAAGEAAAENVASAAVNSAVLVAL